jgi:hypothetical protein
MKSVLKPIHLTLKPSMLIMTLLSVVSIACCLILVNLPIDATIKSILIILIIISSLYFILRDALLILPWSWKAIDIDTKGKITMTNQQGLQMQPLLAASSFVQVNLTILNFSRSGFSWVLPPVILLRFNDTGESLRHLRVWLRWHKHGKNVESIT